MTTPMRHSIAILFACALPWTCVQAQVTREDVLILNPDGNHYMTYKTLRSDSGKRRLLLGPGGLSNYYFIHPGDYKQKKTPDGTLLNFNRGSYALLTREQANAGKITQKDGIHTFHSWGGTILPNGHFGKWNAPDNFHQFAFVWAFPDNIQPIDYASNRKGHWQRGPNVLVWNGKNVNNITFTVRYRVHNPARQAGDQAHKNAKPGKTRHITLATGDLFASASASISNTGKQQLDKLVTRLAKRNLVRVVVSGYSDNQPIKPYLRDKFPSNWALSALRAARVVRYLGQHGIDPDLLHARAFGDKHPIASNDTAAGRAKNRRVEIMVRFIPNSGEPDK